MTPREKNIQLIRDIASQHKVTFRDVMGPDRHRYIIMARFKCYRALRQRGLSYPQIGAIMNRDHTAIIHGIRVLEKLEQ